MSSDTDLDITPSVISTRAVSGPSHHTSERRITSSKRRSDQLTIEEEDEEVDVDDDLSDSRAHRRSRQATSSRGRDRSLSSSPSAPSHRRVADRSHSSEAKHDSINHLDTDLTSAPVSSSTGLRHSSHRAHYLRTRTVSTGRLPLSKLDERHSSRLSSLSTRDVTSASGSSVRHRSVSPYPSRGMSRSTSEDSSTSAADDTGLRTRGSSVGTSSTTMTSGALRRRQSRSTVGLRTHRIGGRRGSGVGLVDRSRSPSTSPKYGAIGTSKLSIDSMDAAELGGGSMDIHTSSAEMELYDTFQKHIADLQKKLKKSNEARHEVESMSRQLLSEYEASQKKVKSLSKELSKVQADFAVEKKQLIKACHREQKEKSMTVQRLASLKQEFDLKMTALTVESEKQIDTALGGICEALEIESVSDTLTMALDTFSISPEYSSSDGTAVAASKSDAYLDFSAADTSVTAMRLKRLLQNHRASQKKKHTSLLASTEDPMMDSLPTTPQPMTHDRSLSAISSRLGSSSTAAATAAASSSSSSASSSSSTMTVMKASSSSGSSLASTSVSSITSLASSSRHVGHKSTEARQLQLELISAHILELKRKNELLAENLLRHERLLLSEMARAKDFELMLNEERADSEWRIKVLTGEVESKDRELKEMFLMYNEMVEKHRVIEASEKKQIAELAVQLEAMTDLRDRERDKRRLLKQQLSAIKQQIQQHREHKRQLTGASSSTASTALRSVDLRMADFMDSKSEDSSSMAAVPPSGDSSAVMSTAASLTSWLGWT